VEEASTTDGPIVIGTTLRTPVVVTSSNKPRFSTPIGEVTAPTKTRKVKVLPGEEIGLQFGDRSHLFPKRRPKTTVRPMVVPTTSSVLETSTKPTITSTVMPEQQDQQLSAFGELREAYIAAFGTSIAANIGFMVLVVILVHWNRQVRLYIFYFDKNMQNECYIKLYKLNCIIKRT
jgi:hypothetical protein